MMKLVNLFAAGLALGLLAAAPAAAQDPRDVRVDRHTDMRGDHMVVRTTVVDHRGYGDRDHGDRGYGDRHHGYGDRDYHRSGYAMGNRGWHRGWYRGRHVGWANHQRTCRTVWRHHQRIRSCTSW